MARLHDSRRPLVVSFRRKKAAIVRRSTKQVTIYDDDNFQTEEVTATVSTLKTEQGNDVVKNLQPTHICPLNVTKLGENLGRRQAKHLENKALTKSCTMPEIRNRFSEKNDTIYKENFAVSVH